MLAHYTSPENLQAILQTGHIRPHDPAPRDWEGLHAVFMCDQSDPSYTARIRELLSGHFHERSRDICVIYIRPPAPLFRCTLENRRSYYISLAPIPTAAFADHQQTDHFKTLIVGQAVPKLAKRERTQHRFV